MTEFDLFPVRTAETEEYTALTTLAAQPVEWAPAVAPATRRLEEPAALVLALIGAGMIVAYRKIHQRLAPAPLPAARPRRAAAARRRAA
jgi:hypothetical protein